MGWWSRLRGQGERDDRCALPPLADGWSLDPEALDLERRRTALVLHRLRVLQARRVPLRVITASPVSGVARLGFADGTALLVRVTGRADALATALLVRRQAVRLSRCWTDVAGPVGELAWSGHRLEVQVTGTDQPD